MRWMLGVVGLAVNGMSAWILAGSRGVAMDPDPPHPTRTLGGAWWIAGFAGPLIAVALVADLRMRGLVRPASSAAEGTSGTAHRVGRGGSGK